MSKRKLILLGVMATVAVPLAAYLIMRPRITAESYEMIHDGMTPAEVEALLGPPIVRSQIRVYCFLCTDAGTLRESYGSHREADEEVHWKDGGGTILVGFNGTVVYKRFDPQQDEPLLDRFRRRLATTFGDAS